MRLTEKMKKILGFLGVMLVISLLAAQYFLEDKLEGLYTQRQSSKQELQLIRASEGTKRGMLAAYKSLTAGSEAKGGQRPESPVQFYTTVDEILREHGITHTGITPQQVGSSGELGLSVSFTGPYYGFIKAMAALRQSPYLMKTTTLTLTYQKPDKDSSGEGFIAGSMTIVSILQNN